MTEVAERRPRWPLIAGGAALAAAAVLWSAGVVWFASSMPRRVDDPTTGTDAIVVLTGGSRRLTEALRLLDAKRARKLFVSGVDRGVTRGELFRALGRDPAKAAGPVVLGYEAGSTRGNAEETAAWMARNKFDSLRLVTANYHMRRALLEFRGAMPGVAIVPHPVFPPSVAAERWWRSAGALAVLAGEFSKYVAAVARTGLEATGTPPGGQ